MKKILFFLISAGLILPVFIFAADVTFNDPLTSNVLKTAIDKIIGYIFNISLGLGPLLIIIGAVVFSTAAGNPDRVETGKKIIIYTVIGLIIIFLSFGISSLLTNILSLGGETGEPIGPDGYSADPDEASQQYLSNPDQVDDSVLPVLNERNELRALFGDI